MRTCRRLQIVPHGRHGRQPFGSRAGIFRQDQRRIGLPDERSEDNRRGDRDEGVDEDDVEGRQLGKRRDLFADASRDEGASVETHRNVRAELQRKAVEPCRFDGCAPERQQPAQSRGGIGRAAADPRCYRQVLLEMQMNRAGHSTLRRKLAPQQVPGAEHEITTIALG